MIYESNHNLHLQEKSVSVYLPEIGVLNLWIWIRYHPEE